jgi:acetyl esterase/lipase
MTGWKRRVALGVVGVLLLVLVVAAWLWIAKPWVPDVELTAPGPGGVRVDQDGVIGNYYGDAAGARRPAVLMLGGSEGGLGGAADGWARGLHREGFAVLVLSYYRLPGQPQRFELVPLETFYRALDWLAARADVDAARIAIVGASKGAEAALLVASRRRDVRAVVAAMPSHVVWNGFDWEMSVVKTSSWSEGGESVPYLPITEFSWTGDVYSGALANLSRHPQRGDSSRTHRCTCAAGLRRERPALAFLHHGTRRQRTTRGAGTFRYDTAGLCRGGSSRFRRTGAG